MKSPFSRDEAANVQIETSAGLLEGAASLFAIARIFPRRLTSLRIAIITTPPDTPATHDVLQELSTYQSTLAGPSYPSESTLR